MTDPEPLRIGVAGLGTVGSAVVRQLGAARASIAAASGRSLQVAAVASRDPGKAAALAPGVPVFADAVAMARDGGLDVVVELIGGAEGAALACVEAALAAGAHVVTANKALLARHGMRLAAIAEAHGRSLAFEGAAAGAIPIVRTLRDALAGVRVERVYGILNGTCNFILTRMGAEDRSFESCLAEAQARGFAEADPSFDIDGHDTAHKLALLATLAFGIAVDPEAIHVEGIRSITPADLKAADDFGYRVKLLGVAQRTPHGIETRVHPTMVGKGTSLAEVGGVTNAVTVDADVLRGLTLVGPGAGGDATATAVLGDLVDLARGHRALPFGRPVASLETAPRLAMQRHEGGYYIRLSVRDRPGAIAAIATQMATRQISFESIMQRQAAVDGGGAGSVPPGFVPVVLITHATTETAIREALDAVEADGYIAGKAQLIRIERN